MPKIEEKFSTNEIWDQFFFKSYFPDPSPVILIFRKYLKMCFEWEDPTLEFL